MAVAKGSPVPTTESMTEIEVKSLDELENLLLWLESKDGGPHLIGYSDRFQPSRFTVNAVLQHHIRRATPDNPKWYTFRFTVKVPTNYLDTEIMAKQRKTVISDILAGNKK